MTEYQLVWLEQPAEKVKFREQAHTYKCQNQELLLGRVRSSSYFRLNLLASFYVSHPCYGAKLSRIATSLYCTVLVCF